MKQLLLSLLFMFSTTTLAAGLPIIIETHSLEIESLRGVMTYTPIAGDCVDVRRSFRGKKISKTKFSITFERTGLSLCGINTYTEGVFWLKTKGNSEIPFKVKKGKLLNNYATNWGHVIWGAWLDGECNFIDGKFTSCDAGSDATWTGKEPFTLYISPMYPAFKWNIQEILR